MFSYSGFIVVILCVVGGFMMEGGNIHVLFQPVELLIIGGACVGSIIVASSPYLMKQMIQQILAIAKGGGESKEKYMQMLKLFYELFKIAASNPIAIEQHVDRPESSELFKKYPLILHDHHAITFICNTLLLQISSSISPYDLEDLMDQDITTVHNAESITPETLHRVADALPGLGIVAAVIGIIITMGKLAQGKETIGHSVAVALVGTFMGVLLCYGFVQPLAARIKTNIGESTQVLQVIKIALLSYVKGLNPKVCVEFARRAIPMEHRPTFAEVEAALAKAKESNSGAGANAATGKAA
jgi:chemotaxis protein MotA